jgi:hypothetical protein
MKVICPGIILGPVIPAQAGIQSIHGSRVAGHNLFGSLREVYILLDTGLRRYDGGWQSG